MMDNEQQTTEQTGIEVNKDGLLPCPFCECAATEIIEIRTCYGYRVNCPACDTDGPAHLLKFLNAKDREDALKVVREKWNSAYLAIHHGKQLTERLREIAIQWSKSDENADFGDGAFERGCRYTKSEDAQEIATMLYEVSKIDRRLEYGA